MTIREEIYCFMFEIIGITWICFKLGEFHIMRDPKTPILGLNVIDLSQNLPIASASDTVCKGKIGSQKP